MAFPSFENLEVWQRACKLSVQLFRLLKDCREFGLKDQITRSAISIASNIAEGSERGTPADFIRFLRIAKGSAGELRTQIYIANNVGSIFSETCAHELVAELKQISSMLQGLINSLK